MNSPTTPPGGEGGGSWRPRASAPPAGRAPVSTPNPPGRRFPAAMSYPSLSDKTRTPATWQPAETPGQQRAAGEDLRSSARKLQSRPSAEPPPSERIVESPGPPPARPGRPAPSPSPPSNRPIGVPQAEPPIQADTGDARRSAAQRFGITGGTGSGQTFREVEDPFPPLPRRPEASSYSDRRITPRSPRVALEPEHISVPLHRSKRARNPIVVIGNAIFTLLILLVIGGGGVVVFGKFRFEAPGPLQADKMVSIRPGVGVLDIAEILQREGVIDEHKLVFVGGVFALKAGAHLKSGEYLFPKRASVRDVVETMVEGKVVQHLVTIPEGLTSEQIAVRLLDNPILTGTIRETPREGSMLPNSYNFRRGDTRELAIQRMQQSQQQLLKEVWERRSRDLPLRTPEQLIILASIIEKETGRPEERTRVAAVFVNRLRQKMRLQTDPTVIYGLAPGKGTLGRPLSRADLERPTPYNTYVIDALPPGPIANPGRASIEAAANPARTKELFFVADGSGGHAFAETYEQHLRNVARLRAIEQGGAPEPARATQPAEPAPKVAPKARNKSDPAKKQQ